MNSEFQKSPFCQIVPVTEQFIPNFDQPLKVSESHDLRLPLFPIPPNQHHV